jgi:hypothetical protein
MSELEGYHHILILAKSAPTDKTERCLSARMFLHYLDWLDLQNFIGKIKDEFGITTDTDIAKAMTLEDDKYWMKKIYLEVFTMLNSIPDKAAERMFAKVMKAIST